MTLLRVSAAPDADKGGLAHRGRLVMGHQEFPCALGGAGIVRDKREGDLATPAGDFPLRRLLYRADRMPPPCTDLPMAPLMPADGWCDAPDDRQYNRQITRPYAARHEALWRQDGLYDLLIIIGHNEDPVIEGAGSAIFIHLATADFGPTAGCVALNRADLETVIGHCNRDSRILIG